MRNMTIGSNRYNYFLIGLARPPFAMRGLAKAPAARRISSSRRNSMISRSGAAMKTDDARPQFRILCVDDNRDCTTRPPSCSGWSVLT